MYLLQKRITLAWVYTLWATVGGENSPPLIIFGDSVKITLSNYIARSVCRKRQRAMAKFPLYALSALMICLVRV